MLCLYTRHVCNVVIIYKTRVQCCDYIQDTVCNVVIIYKTCV